MINISYFYNLLGSMGNRGGWLLVDLYFCAHTGTHRFTAQC